MRNEKISWAHNDAPGIFESLQKQAAENRVETLVYHSLCLANTQNQLPAPVWKHWHAQTRKAIALELLRGKELSDLSSFFNDQHIPMLVIKGEALSCTHYPQAHLRARSDTDIYIRPCDLGKVRKLLRAHGYTISSRPYKARQFNTHRPVFGGAVKFDVHWRLSNHPEYARVLEDSDLWVFAVPLPGFSSTQTLCPVHALLLACMHLAGNPDHDPNRLIWLYDIHLLLSSLTEEELAEFSKCATEGGIQQRCKQIIEKTRVCFETRVPKNILRELSEPEPGRSNTRSLHSSALGLIIDDFRQFGLRGKLEMSLEYLFPSAGYLLNRYGKDGIRWVPVLYFRYLLVGIFERIGSR